ncbi:TIGR02270 family protein [Psychromonas sp. Urea-02u-13]|uniref:TIGR02270 family protein n=1 Tax=Psychromonas sp. Urea-02u-13 TaxID=2058326 RepID=UPI000C33EA75|nr:TIGR02270 family protein [Psychromonas sp. Urea-02u-13]PKG37069.1 hypothetical protein CXF74_20825 [Psychromonas sp. Urea-02u-13]
MQELSIPDFLHKQPAYRDIYEQYCTDASFLWLLRSIAIEQPHYSRGDISALEKRIDAQLNGLMSTVDIGWSVCEEALDLEEPGEVFTAMVVAMRSHEPLKIQRAVEVGLKSQSSTAGLISALGWLPNEIVTPWISRFLNGKNMQHKLLGIAACSIKRQDPGAILSHVFERKECLENELLYGRALRLVGELRRQDCMPALELAIQHDNENIRFWGLWSATLLGSTDSLMQLKPFVFDTASCYQEIAVQLVFRKLSIEQARLWISELAQNEALNRVVIKATGVLGDVHAVNWLIKQMSDRKLAKLAAESFVFITGADLQKHDLAIEAPILHPLHPSDENENEDDDIGLDEDENLPYPDQQKVIALWRTHGQRFMLGQRYLLGKTISGDWLKSVVNNGTQRQRHAAALELALNVPSIQFPNTRAKVPAL